MIFASAKIEPRVNDLRYGPNKWVPAPLLKQIHAATEKSDTFWEPQTAIVVFSLQLKHPSLGISYF